MKCQLFHRFLNFFLLSFSIMSALLLKGFWYLCQWLIKPLFFWILKHNWLDITLPTAISPTSAEDCELYWSFFVNKMNSIKSKIPVTSPGLKKNQSLLSLPPLPCMTLQNFSCLPVLLPYSHFACHFTWNNIFDEFHSGFCQKHSTEISLQRVRNYIHGKMIVDNIPSWSYWVCFWNKRSHYPN